MSGHAKRWEAWLVIGNRMAMAMVWGGGILLPGRACHARCFGEF